MKILGQHGHGAGDKIEEGLRRRLIDGVIYSPKDVSLARLRQNLENHREEFPDADLLFDPQYYATTLAVDPNSRVGKLGEDYTAYFAPRRRIQLLSEEQVRRDIENVCRFEIDLPVTAIIAPNLLISRSFDSAEAAIAMDFFRNTTAGARAAGADRPVYATLAVMRDTLLNRDELLSFLNELTVVENPPDGFYVLIATNSPEARTEIYHADVVAGWMLINYTLAMNGFAVVNGYSDLLTPFLGAAKATAGATGWWSNLRTFSLDRFRPPVGGGRLPVERYLSCSLLNRIAFYELDTLRAAAPEVLNGLPTDNLYPESGGFQPQRNQEIFQSWDAIKELNNRLVTDDQREALRRCRNAVALAEEIYGEIGLRVPFPLDPKSDDAHLAALSSGLDEFERLAELDTS
jgi:hypothetical protein